MKPAREAGREEAARDEIDPAWLLRARRRMVDEQLRGRGITDERLLAAFLSVPREAFVASRLRARAYEDRPLSIGHGQTISQPYTVAVMCEALELKGTEKVLEVGTGCGYAAAILASMAREVHTIEIVKELADAARERLQKLGCSTVTVHTGDGSLGLPIAAPFDAIAVPAGAPKVPSTLLDQLAEGGRLVIPVGAAEQVQEMQRWRRRGAGLSMDSLGQFVFVPLRGKLGTE